MKVKRGVRESQATGRASCKRWEVQEAPQGLDVEEEEIHITLQRTILSF